MLTTRTKRAALVLLLAITAWGFFYRLGAIPLLDDPNEAQYAEVAREIIESGDWLSPHLNYVPFLNKPPLAYWLIALADEAFGVNELAARLPSALAGMVIVALLVWLGTQLFDAPTGLLAGLVLLATGGFFVETHEVRPDLLLTAGIVGSLVAVTHLLRLHDAAAPGDGAVSGTTKPEGRWALLGLQGCLAAGLLAKGMLGVVVPLCVITLLVATERRSSNALKLFHPKRWWPFVLLAAPWHLVAALRHPGFLQDYVVNQHLLFFFDQKIPHDSVPVPLSVFWGALALRLFPWTFCAPLAIVAAIRRARRADAAGDRLLLAWAATVLLLFSAAPSRMEHYSIPAVPAFSLLIAKLFRDYARGAGTVAPQAVSGHLLGFAVLALAAPFVVPHLVAAQDWLTPVPELPALAREVFAFFAVAAGVAAAAALAGWRGPAPVVIAAAFVVAIPSIHHGLTLMARIDSSAALVAGVRELAANGSRVVYDAPVEYQTCAGLNFYLRRKLDLLSPPEFVPPRYLEPHRAELFIDRGRFEQIWRNEPVVLITGLAAARGDHDGRVPQPAYVVAHDYARQVLGNRPLVADVSAGAAASTGLP